MRSEEQDRQYRILLPYILVSAIVVAGTAFHTFCSEPASVVKRRLTQAARQISMQCYVPVGNGGALAEINGKVTPERIKMYEEINEIYYLYRNGMEPAKLIERAERLNVSVK